MGLNLSQEDLKSQGTPRPSTSWDDFICRQISTCFRRCYVNNETKSEINCFDCCDVHEKKHMKDGGEMLKQHELEVN